MDVTLIRLIGLYTVDMPISVGRPSDPFIIKDADGLGPTDHTVTIAPSTTLGGFYQGRQPLNKELVLKVGLNPDFRINQTASSLREQLYGLLTPESADDSIQIQFLKGDVVLAVTKGYVAKIEPIYFAKEPEASITIETDWPYFQAPDYLTVIPTKKNSFVVPNVGTAPTGFEIEITFSAALTSWQLISGPKRIRFDYAFAVGDVLNLNSVPMSRSAKVTRGGTVTDLLYALNSISVWPSLHGGDNVFTVSSQSYDWGFVKYLPQFAGV